MCQAAELPNGQKFFTIVRTVPRPWAPARPLRNLLLRWAVSCITHDIGYADEFDLSKRRQLDPIGIGYSRKGWIVRSAHPPVGHEVRFDGHAVSACMISKVALPYSRHLISILC